VTTLLLLLITSGRRQPQPPPAPTLPEPYTPLKNISVVIGADGKPQKRKLNINKRAVDK